MSTETLAAIFDDYRKKVMPSQAGPVQISETRRAFFAGAATVLAELLAMADAPDDAGVERIGTLHDECEAFARTVVDETMADQQIAAVPDPPRFTVPDKDGITEILREIGARVKETLPRGWGFVLLLFEFGENGALFYLADASRADVIRVMREFIARQVQ